MSGQCSSGDGTPLVVYKNLVADIESVFTVNDLDKKPATTKVWQVRRDQRACISKRKKTALNQDNMPYTLVFPRLKVK